MIFESLWPLAMLLAVPVVIILYLLRPKGKDYRISSNLLWDQILRNQQSKTFLEKFVHNILMYLQILIILLLVLALMSPFLHTQGRSRGNVILVLDTSASMQHDTGDGRMRIEEAVEQAKSLIAASEETAFSIVTSDCMGTELLAVGVKDKNSLYDVLNQVECCDGPGQLQGAESVVETLRSVGADSQETSASEVILFTDGNGAEDAMRFSDYFNAQVLVMGDAVDNVSNNFLSYVNAADASGQEQENTIVCASSITNYSDKEASMEISLYEGDRLQEIRQLTLGAGETTLCFYEAFVWNGEPLRSEISSVEFAQGGSRDSLKADNTAYAVADQASQIQAVLVGDGNTYIEKAYQAAAGMSLTKLQSGQEEQDTDGQTVYIYDVDTAEKRREDVSAMAFKDEAGAQDTAEKVLLTVTGCDLTAGLSSFTIGVNETKVY